MKNVNYSSRTVLLNSLFTVWLSFFACLVHAQDSMQSKSTNVKPPPKIAIVKPLNQERSAVMVEVSNVNDLASTVVHHNCRPEDQFTLNVSKSGGALNLLTSAISDLLFIATVHAQAQYADYPAGAKQPLTLTTLVNNDAAGAVSHDGNSSSFARIAPTNELSYAPPSIAAVHVATYTVNRIMDPDEDINNPDLTLFARNDAGEFADPSTVSWSISGCVIHPEE